MKQTAVEWLSELLECGADLDQIKKCIPKAKEIEKEQLRKAYLADPYNAIYGFEQYYNKTFKTE